MSDDFDNNGFTDSSSGNWSQGSGNSFTEVSSSSWLQNVGASFAGLIFGPLLIIGSIFLLNWNEGRAVKTISALDAGLKSTVEVKADAIDPAANGHLAHLTGTLVVAAPPRDILFGVSLPDTIRLQRVVQMYQWQESKGTQTTQRLGGGTSKETTYNYNIVWSEGTQDSSKFRMPAGHQNPPMPLHSQISDGRSVSLGAYALDSGVVDEIKDFKPVDTAAIPTPRGFQQVGDDFYHGANPNAPAVGDLKVSFKSVPAEMYSIVAADSSGVLAPFQNDAGYRIALAQPGVLSAEALFSVKKSEVSRMTWVLRGVGYVLMLIGFAMIMRPLAVLASVIPFLGSVVEGGILGVAFVLATPLTLLVIALSWVAHRPVLGVGLIVAGVALAILIHRARRRQSSVILGQPIR
jgi:hypothetical protein